MTNRIFLAIIMCIVSLQFISSERATNRITTVLGEVHIGNISFEDGEFTVTNGDKSVTIKGELVERLDFAAKIDVPEKSPHGVVVLRDGQYYEGHLLNIDAGDDLPFSLPECGLIRIPLNWVAGVHFWGDTRKSGTDRAFVAEFLAYKGDLDKMVLANGDLVEGITAKISEEQVIFSGKNQNELKLKRTQVSRIYLAKAEEIPPQTAWHARLRSTYGNSLSLTPVHVKNGMLGGMLPFGSAVELNMANIRWMQFRNGAAVHLTDLAIADSEYKPFFVQTWPHKVNSSVSGKPLTVNGKTYENGFGTHSYCRLDFALDGKFTKLLSKAGIDDSTMGAGTVEFIVKGDDKELFRSGVVTAHKLIEIECDIAGIKTLSLITDFGGDDDIGDHANWCEPRLIRPMNQ